MTSGSEKIASNARSIPPNNTIPQRPVGGTARRRWTEHANPASLAGPNGRPLEMRAGTKKCRSRFATTDPRRSHGYVHHRLASDKARLFSDRPLFPESPAAPLTHPSRRQSADSPGYRLAPQSSRIAAISEIAVRFVLAGVDDIELCGTPTGGWSSIITKGANRPMSPEYE